MKRCSAIRPRRGFSLIELVVVTAIIALMISILLPAFGRARESARQTVCGAHLKQIATGVFSYALDNGDSGPSVMERMGTTAPRTLLSRSGRYVNLGQLIAARSVQDERVFYCPSQTTYWYNANTRYLPAATVTGSYAYAINLPATRTPQLGKFRHLAMVSDDFTARIGAARGIGAWTHKTGYNVLYTDGSVSWYRDQDESIAQRAVHWDNETDDINYATLYNMNQDAATAGAPSSDYGDALDIFRVWWAFCYKQPDVYASAP